MKILVVDDNRDNVELLCQILEDDYDLIEAYNGPDCINLAREQQPDLILLDVMMPKMNGCEVLQELQKEERTREITVIFISARYKDVDRVAWGFEIGIFDYITKPVQTPNFLLNWINTCNVAAMPPLCPWPWDLASKAKRMLIF